MGELAPSTFMAALALLGPAQQKELAEPRVGLLVASRILLLLLVPVPAPAEVVVVTSSTSKTIAISSAAPPRRHVPRLRRGVRVGTPRFYRCPVRVARTRPLASLRPAGGTLELAVPSRWRRSQLLAPKWLDE